MPTLLRASLVHRDVTPIGLDVGHDAIKMLQLRRVGGAWQVSAQASYLFAQDARQDPLPRWRLLASAVQSMLNNRSGGRFRGRRVVAALDHEQAPVRNARLPQMPADELDEAVRWEAAERFPFDLSGGLVRHLLAGDVRQGGEHHQEVLIFAASEQTLRQCIASVQQAGLAPVGLDARAIALARGMELFMPDEPEGVEAGPPDDQTAPPEARSGMGDAQRMRVVADLGSRSCELVITRGGRIVFIKDIDIGVAEVNRAVAQALGTGLEDTVSLRRRLGEAPLDGGGEPEASSAGDAKVRRAVIAAMRPVVERLAHEVALCLRYCSVTFRGNRPGRLTLVGGGSHDRLLVQLAGESLGMPVEVGWPLAGCLVDPSAASAGPDHSGGGEWAVALGCCLKPALSVKRRRAEASPHSASSRQRGESAPVRDLPEPAAEDALAQS